MQDITAWNIPTLPTWHDDLTIFNQDHIFGSKELYLSLFQASFTKEVVFFKPNRLLLHSLTVMFVSKVKLSNDEAMHDIIMPFFIKAQAIFSEKLKVLEGSFSTKFLSCSELNHIGNLRDDYNEMVNIIDNLAHNIVVKYLSHQPESNKTTYL